METNRDAYRETTKADTKEKDDLKTKTSITTDTKGNQAKMTYTLGYYTGWAIAIVLLFVIPLLVVFIEYLRCINRQLKDIQTRLMSLTGENEKSIENNEGDTDLK